LAFLSSGGATNVLLSVRLEEWDYSVVVIVTVVSAGNASVDVVVSMPDKKVALEVVEVVMVTSWTKVE
jgi:hypothetical protein